MERNLTIFHIIEILLKEKLHARGIAKRLRTNHTTVLRKLKKLVDENVLDYEKIGKNKLFFLKNSAEAKQYVFMTEHYKLLRLLKEYPTLRKIVSKIQGNKGIKLAILFGSYVKGYAKKSSDIDIYIETTNLKIKNEIEGIDSRISVKIGKFDKRNYLIREIIKDHVIIKGVERFYEKAETFD